MRKRKKRSLSKSKKKSRKLSKKRKQRIRLKRKKKRRVQNEAAHAARAVHDQDIGQPPVHDVVVHVQSQGSAERDLVHVLVDGHALDHDRNQEIDERDPGAERKKDPEVATAAVVVVRVLGN